MPQTKKELKNFDFSVEGAHVALVTRAANGKTEPLIVKKAPVEKGEYFDGDDQSANDTKIEMSLTDFLKIHCYMWEDEAKLIANSIKKAADAEPEVYASLLKQIPADLLLDGGNSDTPVRTAPNNLEDVTMTVEVTTPEQVADVTKAAETEALLKKLDDVQKRLEKYEADEAVRKSAKFGAMVVKYAAIGATEADADVLKALSEQEGFDRVLAMLDSAVDTLKNADLLKPVGAEGDQPNVSTADELNGIAKGYMDADKSLTIQKALVKAAQAHPHLVK